MRDCVLAGDHVKFGFPHAWSATTVAWGLVDFKDGYNAAGELDNGLAALKWALDYFIKCHVSDNEFYAQVHKTSLYIQQL